MILKKKKILHVIQGFGAGGAETWLLSIVKHLKKNPEYGLHFDFLVTGGVPCLFDQEIKEQGCEIFYLKYSYTKLLTFSRKFRDILKENKYDAIHHHQDFISGWHFLLGYGHLPNIRISHLHNPFNFITNYITNTTRWISFKFGRILTYALTTKITGTSNAVMDEYGYDKWPYKYKRVQAVYCGFYIEDFIYNYTSKEKLCKELDWDNNCKIALFVGRLDSAENENMKNQKNPEFAFKIAKELVLQTNNWKFLFVGYKGKLGTTMEMEVEKLGLQEKIQFLDFRRDIPDLMSASDILVFPSFWEGLGMVAVEAQANGLQVILSDTIPKEAIVNNELVCVKDLAEGEKVWVQNIIDSSASENHSNRINSSFKVCNSPFSIHNSIQNLSKIY